MKVLLTAAIAIVAFGALLFATARSARADYPKPSPYPISWELTFQHDKPQRIVVDVPGGEGPAKAYWYMTYTVTNNTDQERTFLPNFELVTKDGKSVRSDRNIPAVVFDAIKKREKKAMLEPFTKIGGEMLLGEDQSKDGVAIWEEPTPRMGNFAIYVGNLSGEAIQLKDDKGEVMKGPEGKPIILRKTLQLNYIIHGDEVYPGEDEVNENKEQWVMR
jgi:hypothetical protein